MLIDGNRVYLEKWQIEEVLASRLKLGLKIQDFFIVIPSPNNYEWDTHIETSYGRLRAFLVDPKKLSNKEGIQGSKILILHRSKFRYPEISPFNNHIELVN